MHLSVIIATDNSEKCLPNLLNQLKKQEVQNVIVADAGSIDSTIAIARQAGAHIAKAKDATRVDLYNAGIHLASGHGLWFIDANSKLPDNGASLVLDYLNEANDTAGAFLEVEEDCNPCNKIYYTLRHRLFPAKSRLTGVFAKNTALTSLKGFYRLGNPLHDFLLRASNIGKINYPNASIIKVNS